MVFSRYFLVGVVGLGCCSMLAAAGPATSDLPPKSMNTVPPGFSGGAMASGFASGSSSSSSNGYNGSTQSNSRSQVQIGGMPQNMSSPGDALNGNFPANLINLNPNQLINPAVFNPAGNLPVMNNPVGANPAGMNTRAVSKINAGEDKITTGADDQYSTVIKVKPNGQITMIVVTMASMEVRRAQAANLDELRKKDKLAYTEYLKYTEAE